MNNLTVTLSYLLTLATGSTAMAAALSVPARVLESAGLSGVVAIPDFPKVPFTSIQKGYLNGYHVGNYPFKIGIYSPPSAFIEVTQENQNTRVSKHFQLKDFLTKDQRSVWPKYVVVNFKLVDKLELILARLAQQGYDSRALHVMSGYRTPQYNGPGGNGRARFSRHTYGDAADIWLDHQDAKVLARIAEEVEHDYPELAGGIGVYPATRSHGPFVHVDVRGTAARWAHR